MNLTALQNSSFLQSLGWAIANSLWQAAALWIAYYFVCGIYKSASAKFKNNLSTVLLLSAFVWFSITLFNKYFAIQNASGNYEVQFYQANNYAPATFNATVFLNKISGILPYLSVAYLLLLFFFCLRLINTYRFTHFVKFNGLKKPGTEWSLFIEKAAAHIGITKKIKLWISHHIDVPATIGFFKPVILIPMASVNRLSAHQMEAIILHELSHIKRNDYLINLFISIIETLLFFNPFIVLIAKIIKKERENCCDDFVIQYRYDRHTYASALLCLEKFRNMNLRLAISATSGKKQLLHRIKRIMEINNNSHFNYGQKLVALLLITVVICSVAWLSPDNKENKKLPGNKISKNIFNKKNTIQQSENILLKQETKPVMIAIIKTKKKISIPASEENALEETTPLNEDKNANYIFDDTGLEDNTVQENKNGSFYKFNKEQMPLPPAFINNRNTFKADKNKFQRFNTFIIEAEKMKENYKKSNFYFSMDVEKMSDDIQQQLENLHLENGNWQNQLKNLAQKNHFAKNEKLLQKQINAMLQRIPHLPKLLIDKNIVLIDKQRNNVTVANTEEKLSEEKRRMKISGAKNFIYHFNTKENKIRNQKNLNSSGNKEVSIEYYNGILIINGQKIIIPDTDKILSQINFKKVIADANHEIKQLNISSSYSE